MNSNKKTGTSWTVRNASNFDNILSTGDVVTIIDYDKAHETYIVVDDNGNEFEMEDIHLGEEMVRANNRWMAKNPSEEEVLQTIFNCVNIRGIDLEDYKYNFSDEQSGLYTALKNLFTKSN